MGDMEIYLQPTEFLNFHKKRVRDKAIEITNGLETNKEKAIALFYWVRDKIRYNMFTYYPKIKANLKASVTLRRGNGFCMSKAVLLSALARAIGIPARIHMVDIINHKISKKVVDLMGTKAFHCHAYSELLLDGKWIKATPVFDHETSLKGG
ncbi:MAG: transglutaminase-like domain-containing protein, partial [Promethearchaeota archaeon]